ncbi:LytR/AlgR family response regulator transcription factor [Runella sp.]|uniref:LytR/AlgR family response regulator transcription factor n=1 Tax=Runella sp. TaxID=1960881 RepID=UPI003D0B99C8
MNYNSRILIVEDRQSDVFIVKTVLIELGYTNIIGARTTAEAQNILQNSIPALIIIDLLWEEQSIWIDLLDSIHDKIPTIVITASNEDSLYHTITEKGKIAYLVRPIHKLTLGATIKLITHENKIDRSIYLHGNHNNRIRVFFNDIYFFEVDGNYSYAHTDTSKFIAKYSLNKLIDELDNRFVRVHHSYLVNIHHVKSFTSEKVHLENYVLPLSRTYKKAFVDQLHILKNKL